MDRIYVCLVAYAVVAVMTWVALAASPRFRKAVEFDDDELENPSIAAMFATLWPFVLATIVAIALAVGLTRIAMLAWRRPRSRG